MRVHCSYFVRCLHPVAAVRVHAVARKVNRYVHATRPKYARMQACRPACLQMHPWQQRRHQLPHCCRQRRHLWRFE